LLSVDFFVCKNKRSETERAKDALQSLGDGGLYGTEQEKNMFYTYILCSLSQPEQRYIGSTADLKSRLAIRRFFLLAKISGVQRSVRRMPSKALATEG